MRNNIDETPVFKVALFIIGLLLGQFIRSEYNLQKRLDDQNACWEQKNAMSEMRYWSHYQMGLPKELTIGEYAYRGIEKTN